MLNFHLRLIIIVNLYFYLLLFLLPLFSLPFMLNALLFESSKIFSIFLLFFLFLNHIVSHKRIKSRVIVSRVLRRIHFSRRNRHILHIRLRTYSPVLLWSHLSRLLSKASYSIMITAVGEKPLMFLILQLIFLQLSLVDKVILPLSWWS